MRRRRRAVRSKPTVFTSLRACWACSRTHSNRSQCSAVAPESQLRAFLFGLASYQLKQQILNSMENYQLAESIGQGAFSKVFKAIRKVDQRVFVAKELDYGKMSDKEKQQLVAEVNILREIKHNNVIKYYDRVIDKVKQKIYIIMEYCEGGDLAQVLKTKRATREYLPEDAIWKLFSQIVQAICDLHKRKEGKILHRDIKPANIFLDATGNVKLGDFGLARMMGEQSEFAHTSVGTPYYMSPELIDENRYNEKSDIWACGCLLYEMCALVPPFTAQNYLALAMKIKQGVYEKIPEQFSTEMQRVIDWCLKRDIEQRATAEDLLNSARISMKLREKRLKENHLLLNKREDDLLRKQQQLQELEWKLKELQSKQECTTRSLPTQPCLGYNKENAINNVPYMGQLYEEQRTITRRSFQFMKQA